MANILRRDVSEQSCVYYYNLVCFCLRKSVKNGIIIVTGGRGGGKIRLQYVTDERVKYYYNATTILHGGRGLGVIQKYEVNIKF